jgi:hypothetical protein
VFFDDADLSFSAGVTLRGAATLAQPVGGCGCGGRQVVSVRFDGSQFPMTLGPVGCEELPLVLLLPLLPPPLDVPLAFDVPPPLDELVPPGDEPLLEDPPDAPLPLLLLPALPLLPALLLPWFPLVLLVTLLDGVPESAEPHAQMGRSAAAPRIPMYANPRDDMTDS